MPLPARRTARLRFGRVSTPGARYFLTVCTRDRAMAFADPAHAATLVATLRSMHTAGDYDLLAATVMSDHAHLLFTLGTRITLGRVMAKLKSLASDHGRAPWRWQDDGFEHRLRATEVAEDYAFYIFMNPYCAGLITTTTTWPWWVCPASDAFRFLAHLNPDGTPPSEWLVRAAEVERRIVTR